MSFNIGASDFAVPVPDAKIFYAFRWTNLIVLHAISEMGEDTFIKRTHEKVA